MAVLERVADHLAILRVSLASYCWVGYWGQ